MRAFKVIVDLLVAVSLAALGVYLLLNHHPMAGGWVLAAGVLCGCFATYDGGKDD